MSACLVSVCLSCQLFKPLIGQKGDILVGSLRMTTYSYSRDVYRSMGRPRGGRNKASGPFGEKIDSN